MIISRTDSRQKRVRVLVIYLIVGSLIGIVAREQGVSFLPAAIIICFPGFWLAYRSSERSGYMYLYLVTGLEAAMMIPNYTSYLMLSSKESIQVDHLRNLSKQDAAIFYFNNLHVEKEKYGSYLYEYRGHEGYFVAPLVHEGWTPKDTVYAFAAFTSDAPWTKLAFEEPLQSSWDSTALTADTIMAVDSSGVHQSHEDYILYLEWNKNYNKGMRVNDNRSRFFSAIADAGKKHQLTIAPYPEIVAWVESPEEELGDLTMVNGIMAVSFLFVIFIWLLILERKIARSSK